MAQIHESLVPALATDEQFSAAIVGVDAFGAMVLVLCGEPAPLLPKIPGRVICTPMPKPLPDDADDPYAAAWEQANPEEAAQWRQGQRATNVSPTGSAQLALQF